MSHVPHVGEHFNSMRANSAQIRQSTNEVLMVAPTAFGFNDQVGSRTYVCFCSGARIPARHTKGSMHWFLFKARGKRILTA